MADYHQSGVPSNAAITGHPIHPVLVSFPIAFLTGAFLSDLASWRKEDPFWERVSRWLIGSGLVSGLMAAIFGLIDFLSIHRARKYLAGWIHFLGNASVLVLSLFNLVLRLRNPSPVVSPARISLSAITTSILAVTGWFGGELAYRHKIGVMGSKIQRK